MSKVLKAEVINGRYKGEMVRISNISLDDMGRKFAACILTNGTRANIVTTDLKLIEDKPGPEIVRPKTSMPFVSGSIGSRTMAQTKNMSKPREKLNSTLVRCESCGQEFNPDDQKKSTGKPLCQDCQDEN